MKFVLTILLLLFGTILVSSLPTNSPDYYDDSWMHPNYPARFKRSARYATPEDESTAAYWNKYAQHLLKRALENKPIEGQAKNVIIFLGDGMSIPTHVAARIFQGQKDGLSGEEQQLSFEWLPYVGLSKTYCVDKQVPDSACTSTAYLCGVKANVGTLGVTAAVSLKDCKAMNDPFNHVLSIAHWAQEAKKSTGIVTTTRVTHASPAGAYSHVAYRNWESDADVMKDGLDAKECKDIAQQLIFGETGKNFDVIYGGGRMKFLPENVIDEEGHKGDRKDGQNLIEKWLSFQRAQGKKAQYIWKKDQLDTAFKLDKVLGLFESSHTKFDMYRDKNDPSLTEMTRSAIKILDKNPNGYFLFVEGGRIDHAHHSTWAKLALDETLEFSRAVEEAVRVTDPQETLIIVTSDHAHTMSVSGYPDRGNDILGIAGMSDVDKKPYATLTYSNGQGYKTPEGNERYDISKDNMRANEYAFPATAPLKSETHGGDDVGIFAVGPWAHLLTGVREQHLIPHVAAYAACIGNHTKYCDSNNARK